MINDTVNAGIFDVGEGPPTKISSLLTDFGVVMNISNTFLGGNALQSGSGSFVGSKDAGTTQLGSIKIGLHRSQGGGGKEEEEKLALVQVSQAQSHVAAFLFSTLLTLLGYLFDSEYHLVRYYLCSQGQGIAGIALNGRRPLSKFDFHL